MFTAETGIGVVVMIVFAAFWLAFMLWEDWGQAGKTARARASAKANGWGTKCRTRSHAMVRLSPTA